MFNGFNILRSMRTFLLADNQDITRKGIAALLYEEGLSGQTTEVKTRKELQEKLHTYPAAVVVLDYTLFDFSSLQQMLIIKDKAKESSWILFSDELAEHFLRNALISDPTLSIVMKHDTVDDIREALRHAVYNKVWLCESAEHILHHSEPVVATPGLLTASEKAILHEISLGKTTKEIAWEKNLSFHTVNSHRKNIFRKLEVNNVQEAVKYAIKAGIFDMTDYYI
ncbi:Response regulator protein vraR [Bacteroidales bacterium Barb6]|nr:Response regulator protein vraR [Bacteroidales bacterium Barb4]OAV72838.1 Response regulator protein vraR [Bacteroidales bacterium Barb6]